MASIPLAASHSFPVSNSLKAASLSSITSKKPIPPVGCLFASDLASSMNAATLPVVLPASSFRIHLAASPLLKR